MKEMKFPKDKVKEIKFIFCDEAKTKLMISVCGCGKNKILSKPIEIDPGIKNIRNFLKDNKSKGYTHYISEGFREDVRNLASDLGYEVGVFTGTSIAHFRNKLKLEKSDKNDAIIGAKLVLEKLKNKEQNKRLYKWFRPSDQIEKLGLLLTDYDLLSKDKVATKNRLTAVYGINATNRTEEALQKIGQDFNNNREELDCYLLENFPVLYEWIKAEADGGGVGPLIIGYCIYYFHPDKFQYKDNNSTIHFANLQPRYDLNGDFQRKGTVSLGTVLRQFGGCSVSKKHNGKIIGYTPIVGQLERRKKGKYYDAFCELKERKLKTGKTLSRARGCACKEVNQTFACNVAQIISEYFLHYHETK